MKLTLLTVLEIKHVAKDGRILWQAQNLHNTVHRSGEEFILRAVFAGGQTNEYIPANYYFGLDNRAEITVTDTMTTIGNVGSEPSTNGYFRQAVSSSGQMTVSVQSDGHNMALTPIITFTASGGSWGPVSNLFLSDRTDNAGFLIATVPLTQAITVASGEGVHMRMGLTLGNCPALPAI